MLKLEVQIEGSREMISKFEKVIPSLTDWKDTFKSLGDRLIKFYKEDVFETEGGALGVEWKALKTAYDFSKRKSYPGRGILEKTGDMRKSYKKSYSNNYLKISNTSPYAKYHSSTKPRSKMPYRPIIGINEKVKKMVKDEFVDGLEKKLRDIKII